MRLLFFEYFIMLGLCFCCFYLLFFRMFLDLVSVLLLRVLIASVIIVFLLLIYLYASLNCLYVEIPTPMSGSFSTL